VEGPSQGWDSGLALQHKPEPRLQRAAAKGAHGDEGFPSAMRMTACASCLAFLWKRDVKSRNK